MNILKKSKSVRIPQTSSSDAPEPTTTLKKSKSVRVKRTLKAIANPVKSREGKKATKSDLELKEKEEADKNVDDFLTSGRSVPPKPWLTGFLILTFEPSESFTKNNLLGLKSTTSIYTTHLRVVFC